MLLHQEFIKNAKKRSAQIAIKDKSTNSELSWNRTLIGALILTRKYRKYEPGYIGIMVPTSAGCALATAAALMSGRVPVMINYSTGAENNINYAREKCKFQTVITSKALLEKIGCPVMEGMVLLEDLMKGVKPGEKLAAALHAKLPLPLLLKSVHRGHEDDKAAILFTSGSEKDPKVVPLTHRNLASNIRDFYVHLGIKEGDVLLAILVFFHIFGLTVNLWLSFVKGVTMLTYANPTEFQTISKIAREERPTMMVATPSFYWGYLQKSEDGDFSSLRLMVAGADKCPDALREGFRQKHGTVLLEGYGTTETSPVISSNNLIDNRPGSIGKPIPNVEIRIENVETGELCKPGETGKIVTRSESVMKGYLNAPELTAEVLVDGWYDTGDMGYLDKDGYLFHAGRFKRFVKVGGEMISLVWVESIMEQYLPNGVNCCVVEIPDEVKGSTIVAAVNSEINKIALLRKMSRDLPNIALPRQFFIIEKLPVMGSGKIDFRTVSKMVGKMAAASGAG